MGRIRPKNWTKFQHYKDRAPPWIKLHRELLNDRAVMSLPLPTRALLPLLWLIACESSDGSFDADPDSLAWRLRCSSEDVREGLATLVSVGLMQEAAQPDDADEETAAQAVARRNGFGTRHITSTVRDAVLNRDGGKCCACESTDDVEFDHIVPVSAGGSGTKDNVWLLCRSCNRSKRTKPIEAFIAAQNATQAARVCAALRRAQSAYSEREAEADGEKEKKLRADARNPVQVAERPEDLPEQVWSDWLTLRKQKRAPVTPTVLRTLRAEATKAGMTLAAALEHAIGQGWQGFRADWVLTARPGARNAKPATHIQNMPLGTASCGCVDCVSYREARKA